MSTNEAVCEGVLWPAVKIQSASASPGIAIAPCAVVEVPMPDDGSTGGG